MKKVFVTVLSVSILFSLISCGSKPAPEDETPSAPVVEDQTQDDMPDDTAQDAVIEDDSTDEEDEAAKRFAALAEARRAALEALENARIAKYKIDEKGLASYDQANYDEGCANLQILDEATEDSDELDESYYELAKKTYKNFYTVLTTAYKKLAKEERSAAYEAKRNADSVKAAVSRHDEYTEAADNFTLGDSLYSMQNPEKAYEKYKLAKEAFTELYNDVSEKRAAAAAALEAAKQRVAESASFAAEADVMAPITEEVDGIEDEDAVLLEEDEYEDPEDVEADIPETLDDEEEEE